MSEQARTELRDKIAELLNDSYTCTRVWEAWQHRTMTEDDFIPASENEELIEDLVTTIGGPVHSSDDQATCPCRSCEHYELVNTRARLAELRALAMAHDGGRGGCVCQLCTAMGLGNVARETMAERMATAAGLDWEAMGEKGQEALRECADKVVEDWVPIGYVDVVCDGPPGPESGRFVELENEAGASIKAGEWVQRTDGYWVLRLPRVIWQ